MNVLALAVEREKINHYIFLLSIIQKLGVSIAINFPEIHALRSHI